MPPVRRKTPIVCLLVVGALGLGLAACRDGGASGADDTLPPPATSSTTAAPPSYDVPAVIDAAYVARVMQALDRVYGNGVRHLAQVRTVDEEFLKHLVAIYTDRYFRLAQEAWVKDVAQGLPGLLERPGDPVTTVSLLLRTEKACVLAAVTRDLGPMRTNPLPDPGQHYVALVPKDPVRDPAGINPTPWMVSFDGVPRGDVPPEQPCDG
jgi:hypothetical protein